MDWSENVMMQSGNATWRLQRRAPRAIVVLALLPILGGCTAKTDAPLTAGGQPVSYWLEELKKPDPKARKKAVTKLGHVGKADPAAIPAIANALRDKNALVRAEAALALLNLGPDAEQAIPALTAATRDKNPKVRDYAARALERLHQ